MKKARDASFLIDASRNERDALKKALDASFLIDASRNERDALKKALELIVVSCKKPNSKRFSSTTYIDSGTRRDLSRMFCTRSVRRLIEKLGSPTTMERKLKKIISHNERVMERKDKRLRDISRLLRGEFKAKGLPFSSARGMTAISGCKGNTEGIVIRLLNSSLRRPTKSNPLVDCIEIEVLPWLSMVIGSYGYAEKKKREISDRKCKKIFKKIIEIVKAEKIIHHKWKKDMRIWIGKEPLGITEDML